MSNKLPNLEELHLQNNSVVTHGDLAKNIDDGKELAFRANEARNEGSELTHIYLVKAAGILIGRESRVGYEAERSILIAEYMEILSSAYELFEREGLFTTSCSPDGKIVKHAGACVDMPEELNVGDQQMTMVFGRVEQPDGTERVTSFDTFVPVADGFEPVRYTCVWDEDLLGIAFLEEDSTMFDIVPEEIAPELQIPSAHLRGLIAGLYARLTSDDQ